MVAYTAGEAGSSQRCASAILSGNGGTADAAVLKTAGGNPRVGSSPTFRTVEKPKTAPRSVQEPPRRLKSAGTRPVQCWEGVLWAGSTAARTVSGWRQPRLTARLAPISPPGQPLGAIRHNRVPPSTDSASSKDFRAPLLEMKRRELHQSGANPGRRRLRP